MRAMLRKDRIFALLGAILFIGSTLALSVAVIIQQITTSNGAPPTQSPSSASQTCVDNITEPTLPAPEVYQPSGTVTDLQVSDLTLGDGAVIKAGDCLIVKYYGTLAADGKLFDENYSSTTGLAFTLGQGQVIQGLDQGLAGMKVGGVRRLVVPPTLGYGAQANGPVPANATLVFTIKLLRIQP